MRSLLSSSFATLALVGLLCLTLNASPARAVCSANNKCGRDAPCCSSSGYCGSSAEYCLANCNPIGSLSPSSCAAMPTCQNTHIDFTDNRKHWVNLKGFNGDASLAPLTLDSGNIKLTNEGAVMQLTKANQDVGTQLSTTRYLYYGEVSATFKHTNNAGIVGTMILMSPTHDELDYEFTTANRHEVQTNAFYRGQTSDNDANAETIPASAMGGKSFTTSDFHTYTIKWSPTTIHWSVDGKVVRTIARSSRRVAKTKKTAAHYAYPATPARVQLSIWCAGCPGNAPGTRAWSGGKPDWSKAEKVDGKQAFTVTVKSLDVKCDTPASIGSSPAMSFAGGALDSETGEPRVVPTKRKTTI
ncbi:concanavalin A-like lectin/glucanase [Jaminaea rosea]|uniref:Concanavalin A-like lectin/glucanase n=1 Tax=Jaminaea rosea TaxID=1569628 RepID=A0A316UUY8_9BASI|nr:concanavalin A-like lectin/glucanase [Jaminaea rosea]PWN29120.1 concanavalin A-like lectin/glucanase [Jaminaea rosea]